MATPFEKILDDLNLQDYASLKKDYNEESKAHITFKPELDFNMQTMDDYTYDALESYGEMACGITNGVDVSKITDLAFIVNDMEERDYYTVVKTDHMVYQLRFDDVVDAVNDTEYEQMTAKAVYQTPHGENLIDEDSADSFTKAIRRVNHKLKRQADSLPD